MRKHLSVLRAQGHIHADKYPVHVVWEESYIIAQRLNATMASESLLIQMAIAASLDTDALKLFDKHIKGLFDG